MLSNHYRLVPCTDIKILRDERQRREIDTSSLEDSIRLRGVLVPIIVTDDLVLVAGERRLTTCIKLGIPSIPCRFAKDLPADELAVIELEENVKREDLTWQEKTRTIGRLHAIWMRQELDWRPMRSAERLAMNVGHLQEYLRVFDAISDPKIAEMPTLAAAKNFLFRKDARGVDNALAMILEGTIKVGTAAAAAPENVVKFPVIAAGHPVPAPPAPPPLLPPEQSILNEDFVKWIREYNGQRFNFLHCDFPYGVGVFEGKKGGGERADTTYDDSEETYWILCKELLAARDTILQASCHIMFWFSMDFYSQTIALFKALAPEFIINPFPLVWHKSDGAGITPDPKRGPKRTYETAFLMTRGDRFVATAPANLYSAPTDKKYHPSTKPEPMLRHFFRIFVDEHTRMLDPTCGSGSSVRAAESLGAKYVLGLERDQTFHKGACDALKNFRLLAAAAKK